MDDTRCRNWSWMVNERTYEAAQLAVLMDIREEMIFCPKCKTRKRSNDFSRNKSRRNGLNGWCKLCMKVICSAIRLRPEYGTMQRAAARRWRKLPENVAKHLLEAARQRATQQVQIVAQRRVRDAIRRGDLTRQSCEVCGDSKTHAHHDDYSKPLDVRWLCPSHHVLHHLKAVA